MKYNLIIYNNNGVMPINGYHYLPEFENLNEIALADIVKFTNHFVNSDDLKLYLRENGLITKDFQDGEFAISYTKSKDGDPVMLPYGISYIEDNKYFNLNYLLDYYLYHLEDPDFMLLFVEKYYEKLHFVPIYSEALNYLYYAYEFYLDTAFLPKDAQSKMKSFLKLYTNKKGQREIDFTRLRDLAMFAVNYERTYRRKGQNKLEFAEMQIREEIEHYATLLKNGDFTDEQRIAYEKKLQILLSELNYGYNMMGGRMRKHESTQH